MRRRLLLSGTALAALLVSAQVSAQTTAQFTVGGQVTAPRTFTRPDLEALPSQTQVDSFSYLGQIGSRSDDHGAKGQFLYRF